MKTRLYLDLNSITCPDIRIQERSHSVAGEVLLIGPCKGKHKWRSDELHLRSLLVSKKGEIICSGFPKFRNYGEDEEDDILTRKLITNGDVYFTEKMDGSLLIRSVIDNQVCFRTRGSHDLGEFSEAVLSLVESKYPKLLEPSYRSNVSMLFEYTSPDNKIIIDYDEPGLTFLGEMVYKQRFAVPTFQSDIDLVAKVSEETGVNKLAFHALPCDINQVTKEVAKWNESEGIVIWGKLPDGRMHLAKIKAQEYVKLHSLKYHLSGRKIKQLCWMYGIETHSALQDKLYSLGVDWEFFDFVREDFEEYISRLNEKREYVAGIKQLVNDEGILELPRKRQVVRLKQMLDKKGFNTAIQYCNGREDYLNNLIYAYALDEAIPTLKILRERLSIKYKEYGF